MDERFNIHRIVACEDPKVFTLSEVEAIFPLVQKLTHQAYQKLEPVRVQLESILPTDPKIHKLEQRYEVIVKQWIGKMQRLGAIVKGLWLVDFDTGDGYLCWKFPELKVGHYHGYNEGYSQRRSLAEVIEEYDPDWAL